MERRIPLILVVVVSVGIFSTGGSRTLADPPAAGSTNAQVAKAATTECAKSFTTGSGDTHFSWCYTLDGNITQLAFPAGQEHIRIGGFAEGYFACINGVLEGHDAAIVESGFGPSKGKGTRTDPIVRTTSKLRLKLWFAWSSRTRTIRLFMKTKNISGATLTNVQVARFVDFDMNNDVSDDLFDRSQRSVWARDVSGASLTAATWQESAVARTTSPSVPLACSPTDLGATTGDRHGMVTYNLGSLFAGASKMVEFRYSQA